MNQIQPESIVSHNDRQRWHNTKRNAK